MEICRDHGRERVSARLRQEHDGVVHLDAVVGHEVLDLAGARGRCGREGHNRGRVGPTSTSEHGTPLTSHDGAWPFFALMVSAIVTSPCEARPCKVMRTIARSFPCRTNSPMDFPRSMLLGRPPSPRQRAHTMLDLPEPLAA